MTVNIPVEVRKLTRAGRGQVKSMRGGLNRLQKRYDRLAKVSKDDQICSAGCSVVRDAIGSAQEALAGLERAIGGVTSQQV